MAIDRSDRLEVAQAEYQAAAAEMGLALDQLADRLVLLGDRAAAELALRAAGTFAKVVASQREQADAALEVMQTLHEKELRVLGSNPKDAAKALLAAAGYPTS